MPVDLFQQNNISASQQPTDLLAQAGIAPTTAPANSGALSSINQAVSAGANEFVGGSLSGLGSMLSNARSGLGSVAPPKLQGVPQPSLSVGNNDPGQALQAVGNAITANAPTNYNGAQPSPIQQAIEGAAHYAPYVPGAIDAAVSGAGAIADGIQNLVGATKVKNLSSALDSANAGVQAAQDNLNSDSSSLFKTLSNAQSQTDLNNTNWMNIVKNGEANQAQSAANYNAVMDNSAAKNYSTIKNPTTDTEQLPGANKKMVVPNNSLNTIIDQSAQEPSPILQAPDYQTPTTTPNQDINASLLKNVSGSTQNMISRFNQTPSVPNAHNLQSMLGSEANRLYNTGNTADYDTAQALTTARQGLRSDIIDTFNNNGDIDLANAYQNASDFHKENVVPYQNISQVNNAIQGKPPGANAANLLAKNTANNDDGSNDLATIRNHIMQNPDQAQSLVAQSLGKGITPTQNATSNFNINSDKLLTNANNLPSNIKNMVSPDLESQLGELQAQKNNIDTQTNNVQSLSDQLKAASAQHKNIMKYVTHGGQLLGAGLAVKYGKEIL